jgi:hypothetical protein
MPQSAAAYAAAGQTGFYTCKEGACVVDGVLVRVLIGLLPDGSYGIGLFDQYQQTLLDPSGFGPSWSALIHSGIYNNAFQIGASSTYYLASMLARLPNCVAYFRLGEPSGTSATDTSVVANTGTYHNTPILGVSGALYNDTDTAVTFAAASTQWMDAPSNTAYAFGQGSWGTGVAPNYGSYSLACWFNVSAVPGASQYLISMGTATTNGFELVLTSAGTFTSRIGAITVTSGTVPTDGLWHFVVLTMDRLFELGNFYVDGVSSGTPDQDISAETQTITAGSLNIGRLAAGSNYFSGSLEEVAVFNATLSTESISWLYAVGHSTATGKNPIPVGASFNLLTTASLPYWLITQGQPSGITVTLIDDPIFANSSALLMETNPTPNFARLFSSDFPVTPLLTYTLTVNFAYISIPATTSHVGFSLLFRDALGQSVTTGGNGNTSSVLLTASTASPMSPHSVLQVVAPASATTAYVVLSFFGTTGESLFVGGISVVPSRLSYVPLGDDYIQVVPDGSTTAASIAEAACAEMTALPIGVVAVQVAVACTSSVASTSNYVIPSDYDSDSANTKQCYAPPVANYWNNACSMVATGGTNGRQFKYAVVRGAGTITYYIRVVGYWMGA